MHVDIGASSLVIIQASTFSLQYPYLIKHTDHKSKGNFLNFLYSCYLYV